MLVGNRVKLVCESCLKNGFQKIVANKELAIKIGKLVESRCEKLFITSGLGVRRSARRSCRFG